MAKQILADMHTHTVASEHAYSTIRENLTSAQSRGMLYVANTDHFYYSDDRITRLNELARTMDAYTIETSLKTKPISGVEGNLSHKLEKDHAKMLNQKLKFRLVGYHSWFLDASITPIDNVPQQFLNVISQPDNYIQPTAIAHIERHLSSFIGGDDINRVKEIICAVVDIAVDHDIMMEINEHSLRMGGDNIELMKHWVEYAKNRNAMFCLGTDSHYCESVGDFKETKKFIETMDMRNNYILNYDQKGLTNLTSNT